MNEASAPVIDREAAAALIEPLTDLVIRAGAAILAVNRAAMKVDGKKRRLAGDRSRPRRRPHHRRRPGAAGAGNTVAVRRARAAGEPPYKAASS